MIDAMATAEIFSSPRMIVLAIIRPKRVSTASRRVFSAVAQKQPSIEENPHPGDARAMIHNQFFIRTQCRQIRCAGNVHLLDPARINTRDREFDRWIFFKICGPPLALPGRKLLGIAKWRKNIPRVIPCTDM